MDRMEHLSQALPSGVQEMDTEALDEANRRRKHGREVLPNPVLDASGDRNGGRGVSSNAAETWSCPVCGRGQQADDRGFNEHIDFCLSKQTIKKTVKDAATINNGNSSASPGRNGCTKLGKVSKRRARSGDGVSAELQQKKLRHFTSSG